MNAQCYHPRHACAACAALSLFLAACGGDQPPSAGTQSRTAASVVTVAQPAAEHDYAAAIHHIYIAYFGRPAEPPGLAYWNHQFRQAQAVTDPAGLAGQSGSNAGVRFVLDTFSASGESQALFPGGTAQFVDGVYRNLFNRTPDLPGLAWWTNAIDGGVLTRSEAALAIMLGAQGDDALIVRNKVAVSRMFYRILSENEIWILAYTGARNNEIVRRMLTQVDARTDLVAFESVVRATIEAIGR